MSGNEPESPAGPPPGRPLVASAVCDDEAWARLEPEWNALFDASAAAAPPLRWEWLRAWWSLYAPTYAAPGRSLRILVVRRDGRLVGALPLYEQRRRLLLWPYRRLGLLSTGEAEFEETCPDYGGLLAARGEGIACATALRALLLDGPGFGWDEIALPDLPASSALHTWGERLPDGFRLLLSLRGACPIADLHGGFDAWIGRLPSRKRTQPRRALREVETAHARFELAAGAAEIDGFYADLIRLHQARWTAVGKPGCFAAPRFTDFHRRLLHAWVPTGRAVLCRLVLDGQALAVHYGFRVGDKFDFYQTGAAAEGDQRIRSPGISAHLLLMKHLAGLGVTRYDFLRNSSGYKKRLATDEVQLHSLRLRRNGPPARAYDLAVLGARAANKALALFRRRGRPGRPGGATEEPDPA